MNSLSRVTAPIILTFALFLSSSASAKSLLGVNGIASANNSQKNYRIAQTDPDESYDPFTDYSEFDEASEEEADINFFKNGRFFTSALTGGYRGFTDNMSTTYGSGPTYGLLISYFFDLRLALSFGFMTGDHSVLIKTSLNPSGYSGNVSLSMINFDLKYYLTTQNVTKGLADLNPYILGGFAQHYRTYTMSGIEGFSKDATMGVDAGLGLEIPLLRRKAFLGLQGVYHYVNFADENKDFLQGTELLVKRVSGDYWDTLIIIGMNF